MVYLLAIIALLITFISSSANTNVETNEIWTKY